jgi:Acyl-CoA dehydrogenase, C-terminal domain/Acyl-CoA dehydrogenase, N-terminal domain
MNGYRPGTTSKESLLALCQSALALAEGLLEKAQYAVSKLVTESGEARSSLFEVNQIAAHGFAWQATYVKTLRKALRWARDLRETDSLTDIEAAILRLGFAEYLSQLGGGIPISQTEIIRPSDLGVSADVVTNFLNQPVLAQLAEPASLNTARYVLARAAVDGNFGNLGNSDETLGAIREEFQRYTAAEIAPHAQDWHRRDDLIPTSVVQQLAEMGVFGMTIKEEHGGLALGKMANLLGGVEGQGFKQLMETFESARIQTGARALGVARNALELGVNYAKDGMQFGKAIIEFPRVNAKIAWMITETMFARQLTYFAARQKDNGQRCDVDAGMAKLLAARVAWSNADCALQIHGGNGYAVEYPISRVLCDARILSIFEGAAEIQAQVIARGLLGRRN